MPRPLPSGEIMDGDPCQRKEAMKKHKAINMYQFLKANKSKLNLLKEDKIATPLVDARNVIEELYGSDSDSEKHN